MSADDDGFSDPYCVVKVNKEKVTSILVTPLDRRLLQGVHLSSYNCVNLLLSCIYRL